MDYITRASHKPYQKEEYMYVCIITEDVYKEKMRFIIIGLIWLPLLVNILCVDCVVWSVSTVINDVDDYWHGVEVWLLWHLTSSLVNIWSSGNQTSSQSKHHFLLLHFISRDSADSCQAHQYFGFKTTSHQYLRNSCQTEVDMEQIDKPTTSNKPTQPVLQQ